MNSTLVLGFLMCCVALGQARYVSRKRPVHPVKQEYCLDYVGRPVYPGSSYYDGCNTCTCGPYGQPTRCIRKYCGPVKPILPVKPVYPTKPVYPVKPVRPVQPVYPINLILPVDPVYPINPVHPIKPVYPVIDPIRPVYKGKRSRGRYGRRREYDD